MRVFIRSSAHRVRKYRSIFTTENKINDPDLHLLLSVVTIYTLAIPVPHEHVGPERSPRKHLIQRLFGLVVAFHHQSLRPQREAKEVFVRRLAFEIARVLPVLSVLLNSEYP